MYQPGGTFGPRTQRDYQLVVLHSGSLRLELDGDEFDFAPNQAFLLLPGGREFFRFAPDRTTTHSWVAARASLPMQGLGRMKGQPPPCIPLSTDLARLVDEAIAWYKDASAPADRIAKATTYAALELFFHEAGLLAAEQPWPEPVQRARAFARAHLDSPLELADLAGAAAVSAEYLCRLFSQACRQSPMQFVWSERTEHGLRLLRSTGLPIALVAERCGFTSTHHFSRRVKQATGLSPSAYRKSRWNP